MLSFRIQTAVLSVLSLLAASGAAQTNDGCYSSPGSLKFKKHDMYMTFAVCQSACGSSKVMGLFNGGDCYCGDEIPANSAKTQTSDCSTVCNGYGQDKCGGPSAYTILTINGTPAVAGSGSSGDSSDDPAPGSTPVQQPTSAATTPAPTATVVSTATPSVVTTAVVYSSAGNRVVQTVVQTIAAPAQTAPAPTPSASQSSGGGISSGAIAAAVVVSVLGVAGIVAGIFFFMKWKKGRDEMSHHRRIQSTNAFGAPPSITDSRLDPSMVERRNSDGSIFADNQDYSRRILKVANPDDR